MNNKKDMKPNKFIAFCCVVLFNTGCVNGGTLCSSDIQELRNTASEYKAIFSKNVRIRNSSDCYVLYNMRMEPGDSERRDMCFKIVAELKSMKNEFREFVDEVKNLKIGRGCDNMVDVKSEFSLLNLHMATVLAYMSREVVFHMNKSQEAFTIKSR